MVTGPIYEIGVKALYDNTELTSGVTEAKTAIESLDDSAATAASDISTSFDTIPASVDNTTTSIVNTSGKKLKSVGKTLGTDFATSMTQGISSGDVAGSVSGIFSSLAAVGGLAALGIGLGGTLIAGVIKGAAEKRQELIDQFNSAFDDLEVLAKQSGKEISDAILAGFTVKEAFESVGEAFGGDAQTGIAKIEDSAVAIGVSFESLSELIKNGVNPETALTNQLLRKRLITIADAAKTEEGITEEMAEESHLLEQILKITQAQTAEHRDLKKAGEAERDVLRSIQDHQTRILSDAQSYADELNRAADASERLAARLAEIAGREFPNLDQLAGRFSF